MHLFSSQLCLEDILFWLGNPLVPALKCLIKYFLFIDLWLFTGRSVYRVGLQKAFDLLKASAVGETDKTRRRIILFLTDGDPTDERELIFKTIRDRNLELNNSVIIFTFGIDTPNPEILTDIAIQNTTKYGYPRNVSVGDITVKYM